MVGPPPARPSAARRQGPPCHREGELQGSSPGPARPSHDRLLALAVALGSLATPDGVRDCGHLNNLASQLSLVLEEGFMDPGCPTTTTQ